MTRPLPFVFSQSVERKGPYSAWYIFHNPHFCETDERKLLSKMLISPDLFFTFRILNKTVIRILTQNDVNFKCKLIHRK